ncbi:selenocysteine-specific translation elongation factor [Proteinivorax hydrogeniformans]|uniref:Selenocysteine-specific elongation factor n=1 Tax=Proteinivorax hydrogeniformans TaxID=1826727 RepID=A0AAU8HSX7_9FIRM
MENKHIIIGTSGHVDHGKTSLIKSLTGVDTDRLKEEQNRGITIQLGFTYFDLPNGEKAGIVDVPGHEKFVRNMLAGVGGLDVVLLVVAADEGVMPQTREHLDILRLLGVQKGIIVITKKDLVDDDLLELAKEDILDEVSGTFLEDAPVAEVSTHNQEGIEDLKKIITDTVQHVDKPKPKDFFRLPVDRSFSLKGIGTVVTGTLKDGVIKVGDVVEVFPSEATGKVRQIQVHKNSVEEAYLGQRVAVNLTGLEKEQVGLGSMLATQDYFSAKNKVNCKLKLLENSRKITTGTMVRLHVGTQESIGRLVLLDREELNPSDDAFCQIRLKEKVVAAKDDPFVIRAMSPVVTIGGGKILGATNKRVKRYDEDALLGLRIRDEKPLVEVVNQVVKEHGIDGITSLELARNLQQSNENISDKIHTLKEKGDVTIVNKDELAVISKTNLTKLSDGIVEFLKGYHQRNPFRWGVNKEELKNNLGLDLSSKRLSDLLEILVKTGVIQSDGLYVKLSEFEVTLTEKQKESIDKVEKLLNDAGFQPPAKSELPIEKNLLDYLYQANKIVSINESMVVGTEVLSAGTKRLVKLIKENPEGVTLAQCRDLFNTTRKYIVPLLEYLDGEGITKRVGDKRILGPKGKELIL